MGLLSINKLFQNRFNLNFALQFAIKKFCFLVLSFSSRLIKQPYNKTFSQFVSGVFFIAEVLDFTNVRYKSKWAKKLDCTVGGEGGGSKPLHKTLCLNKSYTTVIY